MSRYSPLFIVSVAACLAATYLAGCGSDRRGQVPAEAVPAGDTSSPARSQLLNGETSFWKGRASDNEFFGLMFYTLWIDVDKFELELFAFEDEKRSWEMVFQATGQVDRGRHRLWPEPKGEDYMSYRSDNDGKVLVLNLHKNGDPDDRVTFDRVELR